MTSFKILVTGPFNSGKTTIVKTLCELSMTTERPLTREEERRVKSSTTVGMDFGVIDLGDGYYVRLFGTPGQRRFSFIWHILAKSMHGYILMVDSSDESSIIEAQDILAEFRSTYPSTPFIVAANKQDIEGALKPEDIRLAMSLREDVVVVPSVAKSHESAWVVLRTLLETILEKTHL
ncbi:MAG: ADP-ribosylation factor-like protein [Nitrososphaerota archaeon]|nr:ADP-ribosylation factor-like protein [Candidatus Calditenuaceae archaeon]MDW8073167.1 ADP-ribosylation factor-like protein [Nitrososphaerota archaeon]